MAKYDVAIVGGGPGGYVAAIRAAQLGLKSVLVESERVGGLCLNWGCIPSKALLWNAELVHLFRDSADFGITYDALRIDIGIAIDRSRSVVERMVKGVEFLLKKNKVTVVIGQAVVKSQTEVAVEGSGDLIEAAHVILATGAHARSLPELPPDHDVVMTSREALELREQPESVIIVGGGPIGCEFAYFYRAYGAKVTIVELLDRLLPLEDEDVSKHLERAFKQQGIAFKTGARVEGAQLTSDKATLTISAGGASEELVADKVLVGVGMTASTSGLGLENVGIALERGFITVDERMRTNVDGVYAIGDVTGKLALAHVASAQGAIAVEDIAGLAPLPLVYERLPRCTYCQPQVASLGLTESAARKRGIEVKTGTFPYRGNGKAIAIGKTDGFVKLVIDASTDQIVGYHMIGHDATELLGEAALGDALEATPRELGWSVHAHPTLSEVVKEAALDVNNEAIHFWNDK